MKKTLKNQGLCVIRRNTAKILLFIVHSYEYKPCTLDFIATLFYSNRNILEVVPGANTTANNLAVKGFRRA